MKHIFLLLYSLFFFEVLHAQDNTSFDFWLGKWQLTWSDSLHGSNHIQKILDANVVYESFDGNPGMSLKGHSYSVFDSQTRRWKQTWVDNEGAYLDFEGEMKADSMILSRSFLRNDQSVFQRMVWTNIKLDELDWFWQTSIDSGKTWQTNWHIVYKRER